MTDTVTIDCTEYCMLIAADEMLADNTAFDRVTNDLRNGKDELVSEAFSNRILDGESPLKVFRELRNLSRTALAHRAGVHRVQITDIESGKSNGSVATMRKLAKALGVLVEDLV